jgi:hypothetical protein
MSSGAIADSATISEGQTGSLQLFITTQRMPVINAANTHLINGIGKKILQ